MSATRAFAANNAKSPLSAASIARREAGPTDVELEILFCGVCHSDLHTVRNEWSVWPTVYPCVPGHEIVGRVTKVGAKVAKFKPGNSVAVDLRVGSPTFCQWFGAELDHESGRMLYIPEGCGHGYLTLAPNTDLVYQASVPYAPKSATGVRHDDPAFNIEWTGAIKVISPQDQKWPSFSSDAT